MALEAGLCSVAVSENIGAFECAYRGGEAGTSISSPRARLAIVEPPPQPPPARAPRYAPLVSPLYFCSSYPRLRGISTHQDDTIILLCICTRVRFCGSSDKSLLFFLGGEEQVRTKTCRHLGCEKTPSYGFPCKSREYCKPHALEGMVYNAGRRCRFRGCAAPGAFNYPGSTRGGSFCDEHKEVCAFVSSSSDDYGRRNIRFMIQPQPRRCHQHVPIPVQRVLPTYRAYQLTDRSCSGARKSEHEI